MGIVVVVILAACGSPRSAPTKPPVLVAALGDGVTAGAPGYYPDHGARRLLGFGDNPGSQWEYWAQKQHPGLTFRNCGIYGQRTDQLAARLTSCAVGASILIIEGGNEDIRQGRSPTTAAHNLAQIVKRAQRLGLTVEITDLIPWNNGYPEAATKLQTLNRLIARLGRSDHIPVLHFYTTLNDPTHPGRMKDDWTAEGDYPSTIGYQRLGRLAFHLP